jgi:hypothetical protein
VAQRDSDGRIPGALRYDPLENLAAQDVVADLSRPAAHRAAPVASADPGVELLGSSMLDR